jgi:type II secretory pathway pseudopilin PulG
MNSDKDLSNDSSSEKITPVEALADDTNVKEPTLAQVMPEPTKENTAGTIVLQWLTYAFWGWTILIVAYLVTIIANDLFNDGSISSTTDAVAYGIAAALILLPVSLICDFFYSKHEPEHKQGASMIIMVIHAVLFALLGIATLTTIAFTVVSMLISTGNQTASQVIQLTAVVTFVLYLLTLLRTVKPFITRKSRLIFRIIMTAIVVGISIWGILGPVATTARTKDDRALSESISSVNAAIQSYATSNNTLPKNIDELATGNARYSATNWDTIKDLVNRQKLIYTANTTPPQADEEAASSNLPEETFYYELCAIYQYDSPTTYYDNNYPVTDGDGYSSYIPTSTHQAGKNCYKLKTVSYIGL